MKINIIIVTCIFTSFQNNIIDHSETALQTSAWLQQSKINEWLFELLLPTLLFHFSSGIRSLNDLMNYRLFAAIKKMKKKILSIRYWQ